MQVRFRANLGSNDAESIKRATGIALDIRKCLLDSEHEIEDRAAKILLDRRIVERPRGGVKGVAKQSDITAPSK